MGHHRCHRNKATDRFLVLGRSGVEWIDIKTGEAVIDHWVRGACQYGVMPCNGLVYAPPHSCACYIEAKLNGFIALAPERLEAPGTDPSSDADRLQPFPAYGSAPWGPQPRTSSEDWPTYRHDAARTGRASTRLPAELSAAWERRLGGPLTSLVVADDKVFVAQVEAHTLYALDASSGQTVWQRTLGGRVDSPPTIHNGLCLIGCRDGYVYCMRATDGVLVWRFRAAREDRRIVAGNQLESTWPVNGSILIHDGSAYFAAGRCSYVDGGMILYRLHPATGEEQARRHLASRDPETGREPQDLIRGVSMPGALPDILASHKGDIYMRHSRFDADLNGLPCDVPHLFSPAGFLDGSWWHRTYWLYGTRMQTGWSGWGRAGYEAPAGRLMVAGESEIYVFGRLNQYGTHGAHVGLPSDGHPWGDVPERTPHHVLFASGKDPEVIELKDVKSRFNKRIKPKWAVPINMWVRAMILTDDALAVAGVIDPLLARRPDAEPFQGGKRGVLRVMSATDGALLAEHALSAPPAWDAMAAARGRLYLATTDGRVACMGG
jgi:hypothetical protein